LPPNLRATFADQKRGGVLSFRFEDGTVLDTCGNLGLSALAPNLELAAGETIEQPVGVLVVAAFAAEVPGGPQQQCPLAVTDLSSGVSLAHAIVDTLATSEVERQIDSARHGGAGNNYLDIRVRNDTQQSIAAFEFAAAYSNRMGDETTSATYISQNDRPIKPGAAYKSSLWIAPSDRKTARDRCGSISAGFDTAMARCGRTMAAVPVFAVLRQSESAHSSGVIAKAISPPARGNEKAEVR
jgi:hypothetical protein